MLPEPVTAPPKSSLFELLTRLLALRSLTTEAVSEVLPAHFTSASQDGLVEVLDGTVEPAAEFIAVQLRLPRCATNDHDGCLVGTVNPALHVTAEDVRVWYGGPTRLRYSLAEHAECYTYGLAGGDLTVAFDVTTRQVGQVTIRRARG